MRFRSVSVASLAAVLTLSAGIASVVTMVSIYWRVVLHPVTVRDADSVVAIARVAPPNSTVVKTLSWPRVQAIRASASSFSDVAAFENDTASLADGTQPAEELRALRVSDGFFRILGLSPVAGRLLDAADDVPNGPHVCIITSELWQHRFGGRPIVGTTIRLDGRSVEVVGILPPRLTQPWADREIVLPRVFEDSQLTPQAVIGGASYLNAIGRLRAGVTMARARDDLRTATRTFAAQFAGRSDTIAEVDIQTITDSVASGSKPTLALLLGAVVVVLLIACANVSALVLSQLVARHRELLVRQALGATRAAIVRQLLGEAFAVATVAGVIGVIGAALALTIVQQRLAGELPPGIELTLEWPAVWAALSAVACATLITGLSPAVHVTRQRHAGGLIAFARGMSSDRATNRFRSTLVVAEVALSTFLLVGAALFIASLVRLQNQAVGFHRTGLAAGFVTLPPERYRTGDEQSAVLTQVAEGLARQPGVSGAAFTMGLPFDNSNFVSTYTVFGRPLRPAAERARAGLRIVSDNYFGVMGMHLVAGRGFGPDDRAGAPGVCVVNETLARLEFGTKSPLGAVLLRGRDGEQRFEIVGVLADVLTNGPNAPAPPEIFFPFRQLPRGNAALVARTTNGRPDLLEASMRTALAGIDRDLPLFRFATLEQALDVLLGPQRIVAALTTAFAAIALLLATVGLYAVLAHSVAARQVEIGIRMAIGAQRDSIVKLVVREGMRLVLAGITCGLLAALAGSRILAAQLSGISAHNPVVYGSVALLFAIVGLAACAVPTYRATRVDPLVSLTASLT